MRPQRMSRLPIALGLGMLFLATGCSGGDGDDPNDSTAPAAQTPSSVESEMASPTGSSTPSAPSSAAATTAALTLFYVAVGDAGKSGTEIGCGDSLVATQTGPEEFTNQVEASVEALLADDNEELGGSGLRNALAASDLEYVASTVDGDVVRVELEGTVNSGGTCDDPRIIEQLKYTAMTAAGTGEAEILVAGEKIEEVLSTK
ncbi:GerMN domain-containing protein [Glutamicibacter soli]